MIQLLERQQDYLAIAAELSEKLSSSAVSYQRDSTASSAIAQLREVGLLTLMLPARYGGVGASISTAMQVIQTLSKADGAIGQLYGNHLRLTMLAQIAGNPAQQDYYARNTESQWFWGSLSDDEAGLALTLEAGQLRLDGMASADKATSEADQLVLRVCQPESQIPVWVVLPKRGKGITWYCSWNHIEQYYAISFQNVRVKPGEILGYSNSLNNSDSTSFDVLSRIIRLYIHLGVSEGALLAASRYQQSLSYPTTDLSSVAADPCIWSDYANLWSDLAAAAVIANRAAQAAQTLWSQKALLPSERDAVADAVFAAQAAVTRTGLEVTHRFFELMSNCSPAVQVSFERYWRDLRMLTLRDLANYKYR